MFVVEAGDDIATRRSDGVVDDLYAVDDRIRYASVYPPASGRLWLLGVIGVLGIVRGGDVPMVMREVE